MELRLRMEVRMNRENKDEQKDDQIVEKERKKLCLSELAHEW